MIPNSIRSFCPEQSVRNIKETENSRNDLKKNKKLGHMQSRIPTYARVRGLGASHIAHARAKGWP
jgi:hypothetical protein